MKLIIAGETHFGPFGDYSTGKFFVTSPLSKLGRLEEEILSFLLEGDKNVPFGH